MNKTDLKPKHFYEFNSFALIVLIFKQAENTDSTAALFADDKLLTAITQYKTYGDLSKLTHYFMDMYGITNPKSLTYKEKNEDVVAVLEY